MSKSVKFHEVLNTYKSISVSDSERLFFLSRHIFMFPSSYIRAFYLNCFFFSDYSQCGLGVNTKNKDKGIWKALSLQRFSPTIPGSSKENKWQSKHPISQVLQHKSLPSGNNSVEIWGTGELYRFGRSLKVTPSHICLPCRQTESEMERLPGALAIKHHRQEYFRGIF